MKTKIKFFTFCLMAISLSAAVSCKEDSDTTKPVINLVAPQDDAVLHIGDEDGVHFDAELSDNEALASYKVNIHPNFDGHTHSVTKGASDTVTVNFEFEKSWTVSGKNQDIHHHEIKIPENATPGHYHLMVYCTDAAGNESHVAIDVELSHDDDEDGHDHDDHDHDDHDE